jgi:general secretion pathway protein M
MSRPDLLSELKLSLNRFWSARDARERNMLALATAIAGLGFIYAALISPALTGRESLGKKLPALREQVLQLQALSKQVASYGEQTLPVVEPLSKSSVESVLAQNGLKAQSVTVTGDFVQVQLGDVAFSSTLNWLGDMQKTVRATMTESSLTALAQPGRVDAKITLQQHRSP